MRYCRRTFFNKLYQPKRIGKPVFKYITIPLIERIHDRRMWFNSNKPFRPKQAMKAFRLGKTPKNQIIGRHSAVSMFKYRQMYKLRNAQSVLVRRAQHYDSRSYTV